MVEIKVGGVNAKGSTDRVVRTIVALLVGAEENLEVGSQKEI